jgi:hypothetical protein
MIIKAVMARLVYIIFLSLIFLVMPACGGSSGSGSDDFFGAGLVSLRIQPSTIDVGDRTQVTIDIAAVNPDGVLVKIRVPEVMSYVQDTAMLRVEGNDTPLVPDVDVAAGNNFRYLVFFLFESDMDRNGSGVLRLQLQANDAVSGGRIGVDLDVNDPLINDAIEFDPSNPAYQEESGATINVVR